MQEAALNFINLDLITILYLFIVGFIGGLVSGFIGSGGAFVLTPAMMSLWEFRGLLQLQAICAISFQRRLLAQLNEQSMDRWM